MKFKGPTITSNHLLISKNAFHINKDGIILAYNPYNIYLFYFPVGSSEPYIYTVNFSLEKFQNIKKASWTCEGIGNNHGGQLVSILLNDGSLVFLDTRRTFKGEYELNNLIIKEKVGDNFIQSFSWCIENPTLAISNGKTVSLYHLSFQYQKDINFDENQVEIEFCYFSGSFLLATMSEFGKLRIIKLDGEFESIAEHQVLDLNTCMNFSKLVWIDDILFVINGCAILMCKEGIKQFKNPVMIDFVSVNEHLNNFYATDMEGNRYLLEFENNLIVPFPNGIEVEQGFRYLCYGSKILFNRMLLFYLKYPIDNERNFVAKSTIEATLNWISSDNETESLDQYEKYFNNKLDCSNVKLMVNDILYFLETTEECSELIYQLLTVDELPKLNLLETIGNLEWLKTRCLFLLSYKLNDQNSVLNLFNLLIKSLNDISDEVKSILDNLKSFNCFICNEILVSNGNPFKYKCSKNHPNDICMIGGTILSSPFIILKCTECIFKCNSQTFNSSRCPFCFGLLSHS
ncbi:hypothetical protein ROZALSC1DRAFT_29839 [Rozella allomycis CSF55]|uniref:Uncharacterized protein n=1 Tax=Rozella allomycis (strain CSF55) TaxID=988480 RepID=A0A4P9YG74_ROZAC|nr:hypothetical protein ROZALSC1DRAFT_29839 [Rozella allomycis CSF55]